MFYFASLWALATNPHSHVCSWCWCTMSFYKVVLPTCQQSISVDKLCNIRLQKTRFVCVWCHRPVNRFISVSSPAEILGALLSIFTIWLVTGVLVYLAVERLISDDFEIEGTIMLITSGCAVLANIMWVKYTLISHLYDFYQGTVALWIFMIQLKPTHRGGQDWIQLNGLLRAERFHISYFPLFHQHGSYPSPVRPRPQSWRPRLARTQPRWQEDKGTRADIKPRSLQQWQPCGRGAERAEQRWAESLICHLTNITVNCWIPHLHTVLCCDWISTVGSLQSIIMTL